MGDHVNSVHSVWIDYCLCTMIASPMSFYGGRAWVADRNFSIGAGTVTSKGGVYNARGHRTMLIPRLGRPTRVRRSGLLAIERSVLCALSKCAHLSAPSKCAL